MQHIEKIMSNIWPIILLVVGCTVLIRCAIFLVEIHKYFKYLIEKKDDKDYPVTYQSLDKFINDTMKEYSQVVTHVLVAVSILLYASFSIPDDAGKIFGLVLTVSFLACALYYDIKYKIIKKYLSKSNDAYRQLDDKFMNSHRYTDNS